MSANKNFPRVADEIFEFCAKSAVFLIRQIFIVYFPYKNAENQFLLSRTMKNFTK